VIRRLRLVALPAPLLSPGSARAACDVPQARATLETPEV
jgi:hypothetical protein